MKWRITAAVLGLIVYVFLWVIALHGARMMYVPLTLPVVIGVMVGGGNWLNGFLGITRKAQKFYNRRNEQ